MYLRSVDLFNTTSSMYMFFSDDIGKKQSKTIKESKSI